MTASTQQIWDAFHNPLEAFIRRRVTDPQEAQDILQDVFLKVHTRLDSLRDEQRLAGWLFQIARNAVQDHYRARRPLLQVSDQLPAETDDDEPDPASLIAMSLRDTIACLPEIYRQALELSELQGLPQAELARHLGISLSGAKSRVQRGRALLRQALLDCCHFEFDRRGHLIHYIPRPQHCAACRSAQRPA
jgi:RNA polymerase sigma-70 factor (ECF subfamily)